MSDSRGSEKVSQKQDYLNDRVFREYVKWKTLPKWKRRQEDMVVTETEWAEEHNRGRTTLWRWRQTDAYRELKKEIAETWVDDSIPQVIKTAQKVATEKEEKGHNDRKLLLELAGEVGHMTVKHEGTVEHEHSIEEVRTMTQDQLREAMRTELRKRPRFADASDEELDELIDAFADANTGPSGDGALPDGSQRAEKSPEYLLADPPDDFKKDTD